MKKIHESTFPANTFPFFLLILSVPTVIDIFDYRQPMSYIACLFVFTVGHLLDMLIAYKLSPTLQITDNGINKIMPFIKKQTQFVRFQNIKNIELDTTNRLKKLYIQTTDHNQKIISLKNYYHHEQILTLINKNSPITIKEVNHDNQFFNSGLNQEVSKRTMIILSVAVGLLILSCLIHWQLINTIHIGSEHWGKSLFIFIVLGIIFSYALLRKEKDNQAPIMSALTVGLMLGVAINYLGLNLNRSINERVAIHSIEVQAILTKQYANEFNETGLFATPVSKLFHLSKKRPIHRNNQVFEFVSPKEVGCEFLTLNDEWDGYNKQLVLNNTYSISMKKGRFNDLFLTEKSFR